MENKPKKKQGWEYAQEALAKKRGAVKVNDKEKCSVEDTSLSVSSPDVDFNARVAPVGFLKRAGLATYADELKERLSDLQDVPDGVYFMLPVKLPKKVYKMLLLQAIEMAKVSPDWTERDMLEAIVLFSDFGDLTKVKNKA